MKLGAYADFQRLLSEMRLPDDEESVVDYVKTTMDPAVWTNGVMKPEVKELILARLSESLNGTEWKSLEMDLFAMGSLTGKQYTETSDLDIHLVVDLSEAEVEAMNEHFTETVNGQVLPETEHPVNYYAITNQNKKHHFSTADGVYDILNNDWLVGPLEPEPFDPETKYAKQYKRAEEVADKFLILLAHVEQDIADLDEIKRYGIEGDYEVTVTAKMRDIVAGAKALDRFYEKIRQARHKAFKKGTGDPQRSGENITVKLLYRLGYADRARKIMDEWLPKDGD